MASSIPAQSDVTISLLTSSNFTDYSIVLETVPDESTIEAAEAAVVLGSDLNWHKQPILQCSRA